VCVCVGFKLNKSPIGIPIPFHIFGQLYKLLATHYEYFLECKNEKNFVSHTIFFFLNLFYLVRMETVSIASSLPSLGLRELGADAVFSISSAKPGNGVEQIRDDNLETYWQSDGPAPHTINIHFMEKKEISHVCVYCDYNLDESYNVKKLSVRCGTSLHDLIDVTTIELTEPVGWVIIPVRDPKLKSSDLRTHLLQIKILSMHQNGRDTHIRQVKLLGPRSVHMAMGNFRLDQFKSIEMLQYAQIR
jgi:anaphase-promoting complex subunit 10